MYAEWNWHQAQSRCTASHWITNSLLSRLASRRHRSSVPQYRATWRTSDLRRHDQLWCHRLGNRPKWLSLHSHRSPDWRELTCAASGLARPCGAFRRQGLIQRTQNSTEHSDKFVARTAQEIPVTVILDSETHRSLSKNLCARTKRIAIEG